MSGETYITIRGRLVSDPETRFTTSGVAVTNFTVAVSASRYDKDSQTWKDLPTKFHRCAAWNQGKLTRAENIANMLKKSDSVIVYGPLETREYEDKEGNKKSADEIRVESIGKDLTFHGQAYAGNQPASEPDAQDPWSTPGVSNAGGWGNGPATQDPPY